MAQKVEEMDTLIAAVKREYMRFQATAPSDREVRVAVGNAVRFLIADLESAKHLSSGTSEGKVTA